MNSLKSLSGICRRGRSPLNLIDIVHNCTQEAGRMTNEAVEFIDFNEKAKSYSRSKRCFHRVISGLERGGRVRMLTLTSSEEAPSDIQRSWRKLYMRLRRRRLIEGYIKVPERTKEGKLHLHILFRGKYIAQRFLSRQWKEIHESEIVDIRAVKLKRGKKNVAAYMAKYMNKSLAGRYSWNWNWVWRGFCNDWLLWKRFWWKEYGQFGTLFSACISGWIMWLHDFIKVDVEAIKQGLGSSFVIKYNIEVKEAA